MYKYLFICVILITLNALDNGLGRKPPMGWNPWNKYGCNINEEIVRQTADALVKTGLAAAGYIYLNLDDCWQSARDPATKKIIADPVKFPSGIPSLVQYVHSRGLKFGLYSDAGMQTCEGKPGSLGYEEIDAQTYAEWDIDYLKYDNCHTDGTSPKVRYPPMSAALMKQTKKIYFSMCEWGLEKPWLWAPPIANSWRTTGDISDHWYSFIAILEEQANLAQYAGPGQWNDPDMLEVGNGGMKTHEYQAHFALWAILKAPLLIGCDITNMSQDTKKILMNPEVIAVNQDSLGIQATRVKKVLTSEVWAAQVADNGAGVVAVLFNQASLQESITIEFDKLGISGDQNVRDLINQVELGVATVSYTTQVPARSVVMVKFRNARSEQ
ncbi:unnamed protein product (macronuclear) [Paramecium tetraurelia]|uniref:Alpha-galactosidase n=1 Tax=Paramecium tetraurelia TaxID=5888 RepID=A0D9J1_PARTE|nr:uncharacterized protein GSPATT00014638001 [Paramecium tetraurelia]CAK79708.1 unnamed protein product [Paramecium tetraurelia]|eukprot:XP_001447105.1 hypothetical protein (macronuclear) [Paramecium tetraurelia strain d4-2]